MSEIKENIEILKYLALFKTKNRDALIRYAGTSEKILYLKTIAFLVKNKYLEAANLILDYTKGHKIKYLPLLELQKKLLSFFLLSNESLLSNKEIQASLTSAFGSNSNGIETSMLYVFSKLKNEDIVIGKFKDQARYNPYNEEIAHKWAVFSYMYANRLVAEGKHKLAYQQYLHLTANVVFLLVNEAYLKNLVEKRCEQYHVEYSNQAFQAFKKQIEDYTIDIFTKLKSKSLVFSKLDLIFEIEINAAKAYKNSKLFQEYFKANNQVGFGHLFIKDRGLEPEIKEFAIKLINIEKFSSKHIYQEISMFLFGFVPDSKSNKEYSNLKYWLAGFGESIVLMDKGRLLDALDTLQLGNVLVENIKYPINHYDKALIKKELITSIYLKIAENDIKNISSDYYDAEKYWKLAIDSSVAWNGKKQTIKTIVDTAFGRVKLLKRKQLEKAIKVMECANNCAEDGNLKGELASLLRHHGVIQANKIIKSRKKLGLEEIEKLEETLPVFRRSLIFNPMLKATRLDLVTVLRTCSNWRFNNYHTHIAIKQVKEMVRILNDGLMLYPDDAKFGEEYIEAKRIYNIVVQKENTSNENAIGRLRDFIDIWQEMQELEEEKSAFSLNKQGELKLRLGNFLGAINDFENALKLDPSYYKALNNLKKARTQYFLKILLKDKPKF